MRITVAKTGIRGTQQYLVRLRLRYLDGLDGHGLVSFVEDSCPHRLFLPTILRWTLAVGGGVVNLIAGAAVGPFRVVQRSAMM